MAKSPAQIVKDKFGDKQKLVDAVKQFVNEDLWVGRENKDKGLARVSNAKLLRLLETFTAVQSKWGTRSKLIDAVVDAAGRAKDAGYRAGLESWPVPRLYDTYKSLTAKKAEKPAKKRQSLPPPAAKKAAAPKKPATKKGAAPKKAPKKGAAPKR
ncbi:MAG: hypothetical protein HYV09_40355 [Deltaproteobacteria bacterium]|nr:hypothetical protein [Deltaproteobacteria bacterium]